MRLPPSRRHDWQTRKTYEQPHLPQGAPTSPALSNFAAYSLDCRLAGLAKSFGANYTRYADDLAFSGSEDFFRRLQPFLTIIKDIAQNEGFALNAGKTRIMKKSTNQHLTGIVTNDHINVSRPNYDALKATLHNCKTRGPDTQNVRGATDFRARLNGRVTWLENVNPLRGQKLRALFNQINWP